MNTNNNDNLSKESMSFVKNNCMTWCNFDGCDTRKCEKTNKSIIMELQIIGSLDRYIPVSTSYEYFERRDGDIDEDKGLSKDQELESGYIQNILSIDISIYLSRRTVGCCGSVIDNLRSLSSRFINEYQDKFKKTYEDYNSEVDF